VLPRNGKGEEPPAGDPALGVGVHGFSPAGGGSKRGAISADGSRVVFSEEGSRGPAALYLRDVPQGRTIQLDLPQGCSEPECHGGRGVFQLAIEPAGGRGERVLFTDEQRLTSDSGAIPPNISDLYECEIVEGPQGIECRLADLTPGQGGESAGVKGSVIGASTDGSYVYFVASGVLTQTAGPDGQTAQPGAPNLYVWHEGAIGLVGVLAGGDLPDWGDGPQSSLNVGENEYLQNLAARVSPDGRYLAFMSQASLTRYDNRDARTGAPDQEVFEYDAASRTLNCVSCDPTGGRPYGLPATEAQGALLMEGDRGTIWPHGTMLAGFLPGWDPYMQGNALYQPRYLSDSGRLFFDASDGLVPKDVNGTWDVYEYEPENVPEGSRYACSASAANAGDVYEPARAYEANGASGEAPAGCVALISSGGFKGESVFLDASESGGDVFFLTAAKLSPQDYDTSVDLYDAHECTTESPCIPPPPSGSPECVTAESCRAAPSTTESNQSIYGPPSSATFNGQGNVIPPPPPVAKPETRKQRLTKALAACRKDRSKQKRRRCEALAKRRYGAVKKSKASRKVGHDRRTHR
jgi:hypothetical protein